MPELDSLPDLALDALGDVLGIALGALENMDDIFSVIFMLMVVFTFIDGANKKKQTQAPPTTGADLDIPALANEPNIEVQQEVIVQPQEKIVPRGLTNSVTENYRRRYERQKRDIKDEARKEEARKEEALRVERLQDSKAALSSDEALDAIVLSEILGKPKALRRR